MITCIQPSMLQGKLCRIHPLSPRLQRFRIQQQESLPQWAMWRFFPKTWWCCLLMLFLKKRDLCLCEGLFRNCDLCFSFFQSILFFPEGEMIVLSVGPQRSIIYFDTIPSWTERNCVLPTWKIPALMSSSEFLNRSMCRSGRGRLLEPRPAFSTSLCMFRQGVPPPSLRIHLQLTEKAVFQPSMQVHIVDPSEGSNFSAQIHVRTETDNERLRPEGISLPGCSAGLTSDTSISGVPKVWRNANAPRSPAASAQVRLRFSCIGFFRERTSPRHLWRPPAAWKLGAGMSLSVRDNALHSQYRSIIVNQPTQSISLLRTNDQFSGHQYACSISALGVIEEGQLCLRVLCN